MEERHIFELGEVTETRSSISDLQNEYGSISWPVSDLKIVTDFVAKFPDLVTCADAERRASLIEDLEIELLYKYEVAQIQLVLNSLGTDEYEDEVGGTSTGTENDVNNSGMDEGSFDEVGGTSTGTENDVNNSGIDEGSFDPDNRIQWSEKDERIVAEFIAQNPKIKGNNARSEKIRERLFSTLQAALSKHYEVADIKTKMNDIEGDWRASDLDILIDYYRDNPSLWDLFLPDYHNKAGRSMKLEALSSKLDGRHSAKEIADKFENLKKTFNRLTKGKPTGSSANGKPTGSSANGKPIGTSANGKGKPWPHIEALRFLKSGGHEQRNSFSNVDVSTQDAVAILVDESVTSAPQDSPGNESTNSSSSHSVITVTPKNKPANNRKHKRVVDSSEDNIFKKKLLEILSEKEDATSGAESFGASVAESLNKFSPDNQEHVKAQIQMMLSVCLRCEKKNSDIPDFHAVYK